VAHASKYRLTGGLRKRDGPLEPYFSNTRVIVLSPLEDTVPGDRSFSSRLLYPSFEIDRPSVIERQSDVLSTLRPPFDMLNEEARMQQSIRTVPRSPRAKLSQRVRVRPYHSCAPEEICVTQNVSRNGLYFETLQGHYFNGMSVCVTRNFHPDDLTSREEAGDVVRVESLKTGRWGVAIRFPASLTQPSWRCRDGRGTLSGPSSLPSRIFKPGTTIAMTKSFDTLEETEPVAAIRQCSENSATHPIGKLNRRRTRRARVQIPLLVYGHNPNDVPFFEEAYTIEINAHGALIAMKTAVPPGGRLLLTNETNQKTQECTILSVTTKQRSEVEVTIAFATAAAQFWRK